MTARCTTRGCRRTPLEPEETTILRGADRTPVTLRVLRCPRCGAIVTPESERERLRAPLYPVAHLPATAVTPAVTAYAADPAPRVPRVFTVYQRGRDGRTHAVHHVSYELAPTAPGGDA